MEQRKLPFTCPLCGRKHDVPLEALKEGSILKCPFCSVTLTLHGHMWEEIQADMEKLKKKD